MKSLTLKLKGQKNSLLAYGIFLLIMVLIIISKKNMHGDEVLTYELANSVTRYMLPIDGKTYIPAEEAWVEYITVQKGEAFNYKNVWKNQALDVHPPLYYFLLHTLSSLNQGKFSIWYAGLINICFALLTLWAVRRLLYELVQDNKVVVLGTILFILAAGTLSSVSFFRMYVMVMFEITFITFLFVSASLKAPTWKFYIGVMITSVAGALTHYYFLVYLFFLCLVFCIYLLTSKKMKEAVAFIASMFISGGISVAIFPQMILQMFLNGSNQRQTTIENLQQNSIFVYANRIKAFYSFINKQLFGGILTYLLIGILIFFIVWKRKSDAAQREGQCFPKIWNTFKIQWFLLVVPSICYILLISKIAVWVTDRYVFPIYAVTIIVVIVAIYFGITKVMDAKNSRLTISALLSIMIVGSWKECGWPYLFQDSEKLLEAAAQHSEENDLYIYDADWKIAPSFYEISQYKSVTFFHENNIDELNKSSLVNDNSLIVTITDGCDIESTLTKILEISPLLESYKQLGNHGNAISYYLYGTTQ